MHTDTSGLENASVLFQKSMLKGRKIDSSQRVWPAHEKELYAIVQASAPGARAQVTRYRSSLITWRCSTSTSSAISPATNEHDHHVRTVLARQRMMDIVLRDLPLVCVFMDDILVFSKSIKEHHHVRTVLARLRENKLYAYQKCESCRTSVEDLGHVIKPKDMAT
jgi:hypothetical protein